MEKHLKELSDGAAVLELSYEKCKGIGVQPGLPNDQLESFEALTARFARLSDLLVQKALRTMDAIDLEDQGTVRDRIHRAEKKGIVKSADTLVRIRMLRNDFAHEYKPKTILEIFDNVLALTPDLLAIVANLSRIGKETILAPSRQDAKKGRKV